MDHPGASTPWAARSSAASDAVACYASPASSAQQLVGRYVVEAKLPQPGALRSDSYEGDGHAIVQHPDTSVVEAALKTIIETAT